MNAPTAETMAAVIGEKVLETLDNEDQRLDQTLQKLEKANDEELELLREQRMRRLKEEAQRANDLRAKGHGTYSIVNDSAEFFDIVKQSECVIAHFYTNSNTFCQVMDGHFQRMACAHLETRFIKVNAEKTEFLVRKLGVWMIPCIALIKNSKVVKMLQGLDALGGSEKFTTAYLAYFLGSHGVLNYVGEKPESILDDCDGAYADCRLPSRSDGQERNKSSIRQSEYCMSDEE